MTDTADERSGRRIVGYSRRSSSQNGEAPVTRIVLVRHGESQAHLDGIVSGHDTCKGLSPWGRRQAEALRDRLAAAGELRADVLLSSVLPRAVETAEILAPALGDDLKPEQRCDLCELHMGESEGLAWEEYRARYLVEPPLDPHAPVAPGGESLASFQERVSGALHGLVEEFPGRTVVVACHGGVIIGSLIAFFGLSVAQVAQSQIVIENTGITEWTHKAGRWRLVRHNDVAHLEGVQ
jgi:probable phosphoglycerate mutase